MVSSNSSAKVLSYFAKSDVGRTRKDNQDNFGLLDKGKWFIALVCDGMGGALGGDIASEIAVNVILETFKDKQNPPSIDELKNAVLLANEKIYNFGVENPSKKGLGTTLSLVLLDESGLRLVHVGDSRVMLIKAGVVRQLTTDHTWANELKNSGELEEELKDNSPMSHMLTRSVGVAKNLIVDCTDAIDFAIGDQFLICSDGLHNYISGDDLAPFFINQNEPDFNQNVVESLIEKALLAGGADNITAVSISVLGEKKLFSQQDDRNLIETGRDSNSHPSAKPLKTNNNHQEYFNISHEEIAKRVEQSAIYADSTSLFRPFLFGAIFATFVGTFVWFIRPSSQLEYRNDANLNFQKSSVTKLLASGVNDDIVKYYDPKFSISLSDFYQYLNLKEDQILNPPKTSIGFRGERTVDDSDQPIRPIVWENEAKRVGIIRRNMVSAFDQSEDSVGFEETVSQKLSPEDDQSKVYSLNEKSILREQIFDQNEKLIQINLITKDQVSKYVKNLEKLDQEISEELEEAVRLEQSIRAKKKSLVQMKEIFKNGSFQAKEQLAARLLQYDQSFEPMIRRIRLLRESRDYYASLVNKVTSSEDVILKLTASQRELTQVEANFESDLKRVLLIIENEYAGYYAGVAFAEKLLSIERARVQRAIGFADAYTPLSNERREDLFNKTAAEKKEYLKKYSEFEKKLPTEVESKRYLRKIYLEQKKSLEL